MPRIYTSCNDPIDFCQRHFPSLENAKKKYNNLGDGPDGRGNCFDYNAEHPDYSNDNYTCETCGKKLKERDEYNNE